MMINRLTSKWNVFRFVRLAFGLMLIFQAIDIRNLWLIIPGVIFIGIALFNAGCERGNCAISANKK
jgi:hypothetical protein